jgi:ATP-dependent DNA helicase RecG
VGPQRAELLARLGLKTAGDLLFFFPRDYQDLSELRTIDQLTEGTPVSVCGHVEEVDLRNTGVGRSVLGVLLRQGTQYLRAVWFNQPFQRERFSVGQRVLLSGVPRCRGLRWEMAHPRVQLLPEDEDPLAGHIAPIYPLTEGIHQGLMRRIVHAVAEQYAGVVDEAFPQDLLARFDLCSIHEALREIHVPTSRSALDRARHRLVYQELLVMQLALAWRRIRLRQQRRAPSLSATTKIDARITRLYPFELTPDQRQAIREVACDMEREYPMNRLLHGEVGAGKTAVAQYALLLAVAHGYQAVLMAPTEILAKQHARTLQRDLQHSHVRIGLLTGSLTAARRSQVLEAIATQQLDLIIGTHAVLQPDVRFARLGLVVIDEQHRFGVQQRAALRQAGLDPHYLVMTATPIPRTVSMTLFGDLDVSTLRQGPPGRPAVHTYIAGPNERAKWWDFFRRKLREGRQGYVITPLVDDSASTTLASVEKCLEQFVNEELEAFRVDFVHGRQNSQEKDAVMEGFRAGKTQVLVATSVVEVGVDVPNATLMTIENGERFGLAQLHQLRGRISRGSHPGYLGVFAQPANEDAQKRLDAFCRVLDGFELAEIDFQLRGPGNLLGHEQHGMPPLRIADLQRDGDVVQRARADAQTLMETDPELQDRSLARLRRLVLARYGQVLELGDVG